VRDATHNCWAYRVGAQYRFNDDGEPSGTAGKPILAAIDGQGLDRVAVVVTRWFGGIKLGAGGLVRAYGGTAAECLRVAERAPIVELERVRVRCDFASAAALHARLAELGASKAGETFDSDGVELMLDLPRDRVESLGVLVRDLTRGRGVVLREAPPP
jgi:putative IMPACT (imprinted ancient) family translation regulator